MRAQPISDNPGHVKENPDPSRLPADRAVLGSRFYVNMCQECYGNKLIAILEKLFSARDTSCKELFVRIAAMMASQRQSLCSAMTLWRFKVGHPTTKRCSVSTTQHFPRRLMSTEEEGTKLHNNLLFAIL